MEWLVDLDDIERKWYELAIRIYKTNKGILGIKFIKKIYNDMMSHSDVNHFYKFYEYKPVETITYIKHETTNNR